MSPEERAKAICARITKFADWRNREDVIAQAIRDAEDDALERAAELALDGIMVDVLGIVSEPPNKVWHGPAGFELAEQIRNLKSKQDARTIA